MTVCFLIDVKKKKKKKGMLALTLHRQQLPCPVAIEKELEDSSICWVILNWVILKLYRLPPPPPPPHA